MKKILILCFCIFLTGFLSSCSKDDDNEEKEVAISGDSGLKVINSTNYTAKIYFDDQFIGSVEKSANRTWNVPTGSHKFEAKVSVYTPLVRTDTYTDGNQLQIELQIVK